METIVLVVHLLIAIALVSVVLMQRSEGGALGIGGSGGGGGGFLTGRGTANLLTRTTAALAIAFFVTSITLSLLARSGGEQGSIFDGRPAPAGSEQPAPQPGGGNGVLDDLQSGRGLAPLPSLPSQ
ncbi:MAG: preprotein translocase subunit SecG [Pseudomonadota bacterium]